MVDSTNTTLRSWEGRFESKGVVSEIKIDEDLRSLSADIIARACFGSNYIEGKEIFSKLRDLQTVLSKRHAGIPGLRYAFQPKRLLFSSIMRDIVSMFSFCQESLHICMLCSC